MFTDDSIEESSSEGSSSSEWLPSHASQGLSSPSGSDSIMILKSTKARKRQLIEGPPDSNLARNVSYLFPQVWCTVTDAANGWHFVRNWPLHFWKLSWKLKAPNTYDMLKFQCVKLTQLLFSDCQSGFAFKARWWPSIKRIWENKLPLWWNKTKDGGHTCGRHGRVIWVSYYDAQVFTNCHHFSCQLSQLTNF